ncbi:MAG: hypothetical protein HXS46_18840 [Theionarchaea archaeon]|nr:hypothetical protein [Theionarchaea archaeon]
MTVKSAADLIVLLLYARGYTGELNEEIRGITRLERTMYLLLKEGGLEKILSQEITFGAYDFGPYSAEVYDLLENLNMMGIVTIREEKISNIKDIIDIYYAEVEGQIEETTRVMEIYSLTEDRGFKIARKLLQERVTDEEFKKVENIKAKYNGLKLEDLLRYVYETYPESAKKSKIIEKILGSLGFGARPDLEPFEREEET